MRKLIGSLFLVLSTSVLIAHMQPSAGSWAVEGTYLYLMPSVGDTGLVNIVADGVDDPNGKRIRNDFGFDSGFRVGAGYGFCECDRGIALYYSRLSSSTTKEIAGRGLPATGSPAIVNFSSPAQIDLQSKNDLLYQRVDLLLGQEVYCCCGLNVILQGGVEFAYVKLHKFTNFMANSVQLNDTSKIRAVGPELGVDVDYNLCQLSTCIPGSLSLHMFTSGTFLATYTSIKTNQENINFTLNLFENMWRCIPAFHTRVGLNYATTCSCFGVALEVGYEFNSYLEGISEFSFYDQAELVLSFDNYYDFCLQGLYISAAITF